ncbi:MAG: response regulator, partial [Verrucomicrobiota bacterium]
LERVFLPLARDKGLHLVIGKADGLPETILTDRQRLEQILNNLLANAIKFTERGQVTLRIDRPPAGVKFHREDLQPADAIALAVTDTGLGVAPENQDRIFAPFEQVDAAPDRRYGGTGLGLNIARELAHLLGGELQMRSTLGQGSTFVCYLPATLVVAAAPGAAPVSATPAPPSTTTTTTLPLPLPNLPPAAPAGETTLLIIEDDQRFATALGQIIESQGLKYLVAPDGRTGLKMARELTPKPKAIILDIMLPDIDGWKVMEELRADPASAAIPVHFISGVDGADHGAAMGAVGYLTKPASRRDLIRMVQSLAPDSISRKCRLLVVENPSTTGEPVTALLAGEQLEIHRIGSAQEALDLLGRERFACIILDLSSLDADGLEFLHAVRTKCGAHTPSVVVYTDRALSKAEAQKLEAHAEAVVLKDGSSSQRLLDEVRLFVGRIRDGLGPRRPPLQPVYPADVRLRGRKILVVDDDMRTVYALSATFRAKGVEVFPADTGRAGLTVLDQHPDIEAILIDIMMPEMDGYEAMRRIRAQDRFTKIPIIALTAKAMKGDQETCLEAGASAYMTKPVDIDRLISLLHSALSAAPPPQPGGANAA